MTKADLDAQLQVLVSEFPFLSYTASVLVWQNSAQRKVAEYKLISDKATCVSVASQAEYALPDNYIEIKKDGVYFNGKQLQGKDLSSLVEIYGESWKSEAAGTPLYYLISGGTVELIPKPETAGLTILLDFFGYANDLALSTDIPFTTGDITAGYDYNNRLRSLDELIVEYTIGMAKFALGLYANTQTALQNFYSLLSQRAAELNKRHDLEPNQRQLENYRLRTIARKMTNAD